MSRKANGGRVGTGRRSDSASDHGVSADKGSASRKNPDPFGRDDEDIDWEDFTRDYNRTYSETPDGKPFVEVYTYEDRDGDPLFNVGRTADKDFRQWAPDGSWSVKGIPPVLYRLPEVIEAIRDAETIHLVEGEKDVRAIEDVDGVATTLPGGARATSRKLDALNVLGRYGGAAGVVVWQDKDGPGKERARLIVGRLVGMGVPVRLVEAAEGKDAADHLAAGYLLDDAVELPLPDTSEIEQHSGQERLGIVLELLDDVSGFDDQFYARCPVHDDRKPSMSVRLGFDGFPVFDCHAEGCADDWEAFRGAMIEKGVPDWALRGSVAPERDELEREVAALLGQMADGDRARDHVSEMLTEDELHDLEPPQWVVDGYFPRVGVAVIYGPPGIGKTLELISISKCVRRGAKWHGRRTQQGAAVFYEGEGLAEFGPRIRAFEAKHSHKADEAPGWHRGDGIDLTSVASLAAVVRTVRKLNDESPYPVRLLVIEPLIENMTGDENAEGMDLASRGLRALARLLDCCVLVGHHTNASGERARGNDKLRARVQTMFRMEGLGTAANARALIAEKQRNGPELALELLMVEAAGSVVFQHAQEMSAEGFARERDARREQAKATKKAAADNAKRQRTRELLLEAIEANPGASQSRIVAACVGKGIGRSALEAEAQALRDDPGSVRVEEVAGSYRHYPVEETEGGADRE